MTDDALLAALLRHAPPPPPRRRGKPPDHEVAWLSGLTGATPGTVRAWRKGRPVAPAYRRQLERLLAEMNTEPPAGGKGE